MFGKCVKHEFSATRRTMLPLCIAMLAMSVVMSLLLLLNGRIFTSEEMPGAELVNTLLIGFLGVALFGVMVAAAVVSFILIIRRFHTTLFTDEGYLSFTLPVTSAEHILSKFTVAALWMLISGVSVLLCYACISVGAWLGYGSSEAADTLDMLTEMFRILFTDITQIYDRGSMAAIAIISVLNAVLKLAGMVMGLYLVISVSAAVAKKNRFVVGFLAYFAIGTVFSMLEEIASSVIGAFDMEITTASILLSVVILLLSAIRLIGCYIGTKWVMDKKLNLD